MGKIMLNGIQYGVGGIEQAKDISYDNTESGATATDVQGALDELNNGLTVKTYELTSTTNYYGNVDVPTNIVRPSTGAILSCSNDGNNKAFAPIGVKTSDKYILRFYNYATTTSDVVANTSVTVTIYYILYI